MIGIMKREYHILVVAGLVIGLIVLAMNFEFGHKDEANHQHHESHQAHSHIVEIKTEQDFFAHMIPHHEEAISSAQFLLATGIDDPVMVELLESIIGEQAREVDLMRAWHRDWFGAEFVLGNDYVPMMRPLFQLTSDEQTRVFFEDMIIHHEAALEATRQLLLITNRPELVSLAGDIISSQAAEITLMQRLLE
jgi:uncharacterized protein (DUF305 family)